MLKQEPAGVKMGEKDITAKGIMMLEATEQIERFKEFFEEIEKKNMLEAISAGRASITTDFAKLSAFDPKLAVDLLDYPEEVIKAAELSIREIELPTEVNKLRVRVKNLPESQKLMIREIRSSHLGKLLVLDGIVRRKSDVRPQVTKTEFECPNCGRIISLLQAEATFKEPRSCSCGRKGNFRLMGKEMVDAQSMVLEENPEMLEGGDQPKRIGVFLKEDLVSPISEKRTNPGSRVRVVGILKDVPVIKHGSRSTNYELLIDTNYIETIDEDFYDINISKEDEERIMALAKDPKVYDKLVAAIAPSIYGYEKVKESLMLQLMGGVQKKRSDGIVSRGDIHVLLVGDPGSGKSQLLKRVSVIAPKGRYVSGGGVSGAGITAAVVKDEILGGWSLEAGALVLANNGVCSIDEMDKMSEEDTGAMHEALEQQSVSIAKANIQATLMARTTVLAAANPKFGRFDPYGNIAEQINLPPALINRFDLIFTIKDMPQKENDEKIAGHILQLHQT
ncbi:minichromosome maintenance protein MCM, partial [Candidatus Woesearchaeota archaeon]|nr:minichromosome maintenance protein MCM [Candidatus Woesearchaeota archaeon]